MHVRKCSRKQHAHSFLKPVSIVQNLNPSARKTYRPQTASPNTVLILDCEQFERPQLEMVKAFTHHHIFIFSLPRFLHIHTRKIRVS